MWKGFMSFGLVTIPVQMYSAIDSHEEIHFSLLHKKDKGKIRYRRFCEACGEQVQWQDIAKGYDADDAGFVEITDEDFEKADLGATSTIDIQDFARSEEIDPKF